MLIVSKKLFVVDVSCCHDAPPIFLNVVSEDTKKARCGSNIELCVVHKYFCVSERHSHARKRIDVEGLGWFTMNKIVRMLMGAMVYDSPLVTSLRAALRKILRNCVFFESDFHSRGICLIAAPRMTTIS